MLHINIVFWTEALDSISIVYDTDGIFLIQVLQHFLRSHPVSCLTIRSDRHPWKVRDCLGLAQVAEFFLSLVPPIYCKNSKNRDWRSPLSRSITTEFHKELSTDVVVFHKRFDLSEVYCTREFHFVSSWSAPISIKMSRIEKEQFLRRFTHFTLNVVLKRIEASSILPKKRWGTKHWH